MFDIFLFKSKYNFLFLFFLIINSYTQARTPEFLAGTDIFKNINYASEVAPIKISRSAAGSSSAEVETGLIDIRPRKLALSNLNLCYGAELFASGVIQALYEHGNVIYKNPTREPRDLAATEEAGAPREISKTYFCNDIITKDALRYKDANPLTILTRILFYQTPGTNSLANFKVSKLCKAKDTIQTIQDFAYSIAYLTQETTNFIMGKEKSILSGRFDICLKGIELLIHGRKSPYSHL